MQRWVPGWDRSCRYSRWKLETGKICFILIVELPLIFFGSSTKIHKVLTENWRNIFHCSGWCLQGLFSDLGPTARRDMKHPPFFPPVGPASGPVQSSPAEWGKFKKMSKKGRPPPPPKPEELIEILERKFEEFKVEMLESQLAGRLEQLQATVQSKTAVPTAQVYVSIFIDACQWNVNHS